MALKTKAQILTAITALLNDNSNQEITPADVRSVLTDIKDSFLSHPDELPGAAALANADKAVLLQGSSEAMVTLFEISQFVHTVVNGAGLLLNFAAGAKQHGTTAAPLIGNITVDLVNAVPHTRLLVVHDDVGTPTWPASVKLVSGTYDTTKVNYMWFTYIDAATILLRIEHI
jgi:hypothetical protein